jgi:glucose/arabinose dehydrogenase
MQPGRAFCLLIVCGCSHASPPLEQVTLPRGFTISLVTDAVPGARQMALTDSGTLFVGSLRQGRLYAVIDANRDFRADEVVVLDDGLTLPSGVALSGNDLYVGALNRVLRYRDVEARLRTAPEPEVVTDALPGETQHGQYLRFGRMVSFSPGRRAVQHLPVDDLRFAAILRMDPQSGAHTVYADGIRNTVGLAFHLTSGKPGSATTVVTARRRRPTEEINRITAPGQHFGYPHSRR